MSGAWPTARVEAALEREACRLERLRDEADRGELEVRLARALCALEEQHRSASGMVELIERAALRDDIATLADVQVRIRQQREQTARLEAEIQALCTQRHIDARTGCVDGAGFAEALSREWARGQREVASLGLVLVEIAVDDAAHPAAADDALRTAARTIRAQAHRPGEVVARLGTTEFAVVVPHVELAQALALGERVRAAIPAGRGAAGSAVGVAAMMPSASSCEELQRRAECALERARTAGRGQAVALAVERGAQTFFVPVAVARPPASAQPVASRSR